jgi:hypothetical protein
MTGFGSIEETKMQQDLTGLRITRFCIWLGPLLALLFFIGFVPLMGFLPPPHASDSAEVIAKLFQTNVDSIRVGTFVMMIAVGMIAPWGVAVTALLRGAEGRLQVLTYIQLTTIAIGTLAAVCFVLAWGCAAFRPDDTSPDITRMLADIGWFFFLYDWPPFVFWFLAVAAAIFIDKREIPAFPRWVGFISVWTGILSIPAGMMIFFKTGAFAFHGLVTMYIPLTVFFVWIVAVSWEALKTIRRHEALAKTSSER